MSLLLNWKAWAAVVLAVALAASHWKAYVVGGNVKEAACNAEKLELANEAVTASEANRVKEKDLKLSTERISHELIKEKAARAADAVATADRLRELETALDSVASADTSATGRTDADPRLSIIAECARTAVGLDEKVKELAGQTRGLQDYALNVCVTK